MTIGIDFPSQNGLTIYGDGGFFIWGTKDTSDNLVGAQVTWSSHPTPLGGAAVTPPSSCQWAFRFQGVIADGTTVTLDMMVQPQSGPPVPAASRTFTCAGHQSLLAPAPSPSAPAPVAKPPAPTQPKSKKKPAKKPAPAPKKKARK